MRNITMPLIFLLQFLLFPIGCKKYAPTEPRRIFLVVHPRTDRARGPEDLRSGGITATSRGACLPLRLSSRCLRLIVSMWAMWQSSRLVRSSPGPAAEAIRAPTLMSSPNAVKFDTLFGEPTVPMKTFSTCTPASTTRLQHLRFSNPIIA